MSEDKITAFEITDLEGFYKSLIEEAFKESALLVGKSFFKRNKKDITSFKKHVIDKKSIHVPNDDMVLNEIEKRIFSTKERRDSYFILPKDMEFVIEKLSNEITYKIMSHLTDEEILEMCFSPETNDFIWRIRK